jgi:spermidine synthase
MITKSAFMKKLLSYLFPFRKKIQSQHNGTLELTYVNGQYLLDSEQTNYSYGSLQKILETGLNHLHPLTNEPTLLLGLGGGCLVESLRKKWNYTGHITAVEVDEVILNLAKNTFDVQNYQPIELVLADANGYMENNSKKFGLIVVDIFIDTLVPPIFYSEKFALLLERALQRNGHLLINLGFERNVNTQNNELLAYFNVQENYHIKILPNVNGTNTILLVKPKAHEFKTTSGTTMATNSAI